MPGSNFDRTATTFQPKRELSQDLFIDLQNERHNADYNPMAIFTPQTATTWLNSTEAGITDFLQTTTQERSAIAVLTLVRTR